MRKQTRTLLILLAGILTLAVVVLTSCENPMMSHIIRTRGFETPATAGSGPWSTYHDAAATARLKIAYDKKTNEATFNVTGSDTNRWYASGVYKYDFKTNQIYTIKFEAMAVDYVRYINVQYGWNETTQKGLQEDNFYIPTGSYQTFTLESFTLPTDNGWDFNLWFQCADQAGAFKIRNVQIDEETIGLAYKLNGPVGPNHDYWYTVTGYTGTGTYVSIPAQKGIYWVGGIDDGAFEGNSTIQTIVIGGHVERIGDNAFKGSTALSQIDLQQAWDGSEFTVALKYIGESAFEDCTPTNYLQITGNPPANLLEIGDNAFKNSKLYGNPLTLPHGLTTIGAGAFENTSSVFGVNIPASVTSMGAGAFAGWVAQQTITVEQAQANTANWGANWSGNATVQYASLDLTYTFNNGDSYIVDGYAGTETEIVIPGIHDGVDGTWPVVAIGDDAFNGDVNITKVTLPASVYYIGEEAFKDCTLLNTINLNNVTYFGDSAFEGCSALYNTGNNFSNNLSYIGDSAFKGTRLNQVFLFYSSNLTYIGDSAFEDCTYISYIYFPNSPSPDLTAIGASAFKNIGTDASVTTVTIYNGYFPATIDTIGANAFEGVTKIATFAIPSTVTTIGADAFKDWVATQMISVTWMSSGDPFPTGWDPDWNRDCSAAMQYAASPPTPGLEFTLNGTEDGYIVTGFTAEPGFSGSIVIPRYYNSGTIPTVEIGANAFEGNTVITSVSLPASVETIGAEAFKDVTGLTAFNLPVSVTAIGADAFNTVTNLSIVPVLGNPAVPAIPDFADAFPAVESIVIIAVTSIANNAFENVPTLITVSFDSSTINALTTSFTIGNDAFKDCSALTTILDLPASTTSIGSNAFNGTAVTNLTLPNVASTITIGTDAFATVTTLEFDGIFTIPVVAAGFTALEDVTIPASTVQIGASAFNGLTSLTTVTINSNILTTVADGAFQGCTNLTNISLPNTVTQIGNNAFQNSGLTSITLPTSLIYIGTSAFSGSGITTIEIPSTVTSIGAGAFYGVTTLSYAEGTTTIRPTTVGTGSIASSMVTLTIPSTVTSIEDNAFFDCGPALTTVTINATALASIGNNAFRGCSVLNDFTILSTAPPTLGTDVFTGCTALTEIKVPSTNVNDYQTASGWDDIYNGGSGIDIVAAP